MSHKIDFVPPTQDTGMTANAQRSLESPPPLDCKARKSPTESQKCKDRGSIVFLAPKPSRPLSAYNLFFKYYRERFLVDGDKVDQDHQDITSELVHRLSREHKKNPKRAHRRTHGKISFRDLTRRIADSWKKLPVEFKKIFEEQAVVEYEEKLREWKLGEQNFGRVPVSQQYHSAPESNHDQIRDVGVSEHASINNASSTNGFPADASNMLSPNEGSKGYFCGDAVRPPQHSSEASADDDDEEHSTGSSISVSVETDRLQQLRNQVDAGLASLSRESKKLVLARGETTSEDGANADVTATSANNTNSMPPTVASMDEGLQHDHSNVHSTQTESMYTSFASREHGLFEPIDAEVLEHLFD